ncbi:MAG: inorganic diphosphatase, partial [Acidimicrobiales bacterium]|nr:inorganic diphosphatase [Acidimicrobiales bacterium]
TFPGCHIHARPIGVFRMQDEAGVDAKVLCVIDSDHRWDHVQELHDLPEHQLKEIAHFFEIYKDLEPGKETFTRGWEGRGAAESEVEQGRARFLAGRSS